MGLLLGLSAIREIGQDSWAAVSRELAHSMGRLRHTCDLVGRATFTGTDHDEQFHDGVVDAGAPRLNDENVLLANTRQDAYARLTLVVNQQLA